MTLLDFLEPTDSGGSFGVTVTGHGPSTLAAWTTEAQKYIAAAHAAGVKVIVSYGGEGLGGDVFSVATRTTADSDALAAAMVSTAQSIGFDGVDLDWEEQFNAAGAVRLLHSLRTRWPGGLVTVDVGPTYGFEQNAIAKTMGAAKDDVDAVMVMSYIPGDRTWTWWVVPVPLTPLHGTPVPWGGTQTYSVDADFAAWTGAGLPASKLIMGVGGFGLAWGDTNDDSIAPVVPYANDNALANDPTCSNSPWTCGAGADTEVAPLSCTDNHVTQKWVDQALAAAPSLTLKNDTVGGVTYWGAPAPNQLASVPSPCGSGTAKVGLIFYETPTSMAAKVSYATSKGMRGMEFWTLSQTANEAGAFPIIQAAKP